MIEFSRQTVSRPFRRHSAPEPRARRFLVPPLVLLLAVVLAACSGAGPAGEGVTPSGVELGPLHETARNLAPSPDPREGLEAGLFDAGEASWNLERISTSPPPDDFVGSMNSDLAFTGPYAIQGNYRGFVIWDLTDPRNPELVTEYLCPASQSDVSVYRNLLFVSGEGLEGRLDCGTQGVDEVASPDRLRGIRIFDISDIEAPDYVGNVQTCRGSHTHTVLEHPGDSENVYVYVSGSAPVRPAEELPGCSGATPDQDPNSALFRIEVIQVPLDDPGAARIVSSPRIFEDLEAPPTHGLAPADQAVLDEARARGAFVIEIPVIGEVQVLPDETADQLLQQVVQARGGTGEPTAADSAQLRERLPVMVSQMMAAQGFDPEAGPTQCHDITVYPAIGLAGGACEGYGLLLDISDPVNPVRLDAVADENFAYWHSATFNNDGTAVLFTDEWGGGGAPKCRADDPEEWGANAIFTIENNRLVHQSYYKLPAVQTEVENCVAHNGSLIPVPGRDIKVQAWYQGGISIFDWTDPANPVEIAFHDRGPVRPDEMADGGSWSVYWYNGMIVSSEIARGLDVFELRPSPLLTENEIAAAREVVLQELNVQGQPLLEWPASPNVARALLDQLERSSGLAPDLLAEARAAVARAERAEGAERATVLGDLIRELEAQRSGSVDSARIGRLVETLQGMTQEQN